MGDRCNVVVRQNIWPKTSKNPNDVWYYMHWGGGEYVEKTRAAIAKGWRWTDDGYLARIIFDELVKGNEGTETSFGISCRLGDNEHPILVVDVVSQTVYFIKEDELKDNMVPLGYKPMRASTFSEFAKGGKLLEEMIEQANS